LSSLPLRAHDPDYLGRYELLARLGSGGMGTVFLGRAPQGMLVAIKVVRTDFTRDAEFLGRFRSEVTRARQVPPFCTAEVLDADLDHDPPYLVVEYVDGPNLSDVVREQGPLSPSALHSAALGIATALAAIHGAGVIHRDLKPANVLFALGGLKVIDFGIARPLEATSQHTRTDQMVGTVAYMAPERFDEEPGLRVSPASDIFAWGAVVAFAATGRTPFAGDSAPATAMRILTQPPTLTGLPAPLRGIVAGTLAKDPAERPTARELLDLLLAADPPTGAAPTRPVPPAAVSPHPARPTPIDPDTPAQGSGEKAGPAHRRVLKRVSVTVAALVVLLFAGLVGYSLLPGSDADLRGAVDIASSASAPGASTPATGGAFVDPGTASDGPSAGPANSVASPPPPSRQPTHKTSQPASSAAQNTSGRNLALNCAATASSTEGDNWQASNAVDGDPATRWSSGFSDPQWLRVDLGARWQISEIRLNWENAHATAYRVEVSSDGTTWKSVYSTSNGQGGNVIVEVAKLPARFVRMYGTKRSTDFGYSVLELDVR
jgi:serine/threonine protein kinase